MVEKVILGFFSLFKGLEKLRKKLLGIPLPSRRLGVNHSGRPHVWKKEPSLRFFLKMKVLGDVTKESVEKFVKELIDSRSLLFIDKNTAYVTLEKAMEEHIKVKSTSESTNGDLNRVDTSIKT